MLFIPFLPSPLPGALTLWLLPPSEKEDAFLPRPGMLCAEPVKLPVTLPAGVSTVKSPASPADARLLFRLKNFFIVPPLYVEPGQEPRLTWIVGVPVRVCCLCRPADECSRTVCRQEWTTAVAWRSQSITSDGWSSGATSAGRV